MYGLYHTCDGDMDGPEVDGVVDGDVDGDYHEQTRNTKHERQTIIRFRKMPTFVGDVDGDMDGEIVGDCDGELVDGVCVGELDGVFVGDFDGDLDGVDDGLPDGEDCTKIQHRQTPQTTCHTPINPTTHRRWTG